MHLPHLGQWTNAIPTVAVADSCATMIMPTLHTDIPFAAACEIKSIGPPVVRYVVKIWQVATKDIGLFAGFGRLQGIGYDARQALV